jgi:type I restriction enzyme R subunit
VKTVTLEKLLEKASNRELSQDEAATLASRISRLSRRLTQSETDDIAAIAGMPLEAITGSLIRAVDADALAEAISSSPLLSDGTQDTVRAIHDFVQQLAEPLATNVGLRNMLLNTHKQHYVYRDEATPDFLLGANGVVDISKAESTIKSWRQYLEDNKNEIEAIHLLYSKPQGAKVSYRELKKLIETIRATNREWTPEVLWRAYQAVKATNKSMQSSTADLVSLVRFALGVTPNLQPFADVVESRFASWLAQQAQQGVTFSENQMWWLENIKNAICSGVTFETKQLDQTPFMERGGSAGIVSEFPNAKELLDELNLGLSA